MQKCEWSSEGFHVFMSQQLVLIELALPCVLHTRARMGERGHHGAQWSQSSNEGLTVGEGQLN